MTHRYGGEITPPYRFLCRRLSEWCESALLAHCEIVLQRKALTLSGYGGRRVSRDPPPKEDSRCQVPITACSNGPCGGASRSAACMMAIPANSVRSSSAIRISRRRCSPFSSAARADRGCCEKANGAVFGLQRSVTLNSEMGLGELVPAIPSHRAASRSSTSTSIFTVRITRSATSSALQSAPSKHPIKVFRYPRPRRMLRALWRCIYR